MSYIVRMGHETHRPTTPSHSCPTLGKDVLPPGTIWECDCGRRWVYSVWLLDSGWSKTLATRLGLWRLRRPATP